MVYYVNIEPSDLTIEILCNLNKQTVFQIGKLVKEEQTKHNSINGYNATPVINKKRCICGTSLEEHRYFINNMFIKIEIILQWL